MQDIPDRGPRYEPEPDDMSHQVDEDAEYEAWRQECLDEEVRQRKVNKLVSKKIADDLVEMLRKIGGGK